MSITNVPESVRIRLWGKAAGRCEYEGCNKPLYRDELTKWEFNSAYLAHIIADQETGPRGDPVLSGKLKADISNLMLMCDTHHRLIDIADVAGNPPDRLQKMKQSHEFRIEIQTENQPEKQSEVILYDSNVGDHKAHVSFASACFAMKDRYPASPTGIHLGVVNSTLRDTDPEFWKYEEKNLKRLFAERVRPRLETGGIKHLSVFGFAPQPLLMALGHLLSDITPADVFQLHREPPNWCWQEHPEGFVFTVKEPGSINGVPALVLSLSGTINRDRVEKILGKEFSPWEVTIDTPNNDFLKSREQLQDFRTLMRSLLDKIKAKHGEQATIHVFPAAPVAIAIELGRIIMPKADLPMRVYDQNKKADGFIFALDINE